MKTATSALLALLLGAVPALSQSPLPFDVGGDYELTNHHGAPHTQADPDGLAQLLFFGYANCPGICTAALPLMGEVVESLAKRDITVRPVMITVDPARDTVDNMGEALTYYHPSFVGLTGDTAALDVAYKAYSVDHSLAYEDPDYGPVYTHGSLIYLMDSAGKVLTLIPPVMDAHTAANVAQKYLKPAS
ncbi:MAG: SCO family protein [Sulfitobacter sp.]